MFTIVMYGILVFNSLDYILTTMWYPYSPENELNPIAKYDLERGGTIIAFFKLIIFPIIVFAVWKMFVIKPMPTWLLVPYYALFCLLSYQVVVQTRHVGSIAGWW